MIYKYTREKEQSKGWCYNKDGLCDDERCYCGSHARGAQVFFNGTVEQLSRAIAGKLPIGAEMNGGGAYYE